MSAPTADHVPVAVTGATVPRPAGGLASRELADGLLVFDPARVRAHALNPSAAWVFAHCDGHASVDTIVEELARTVDRAIDELEGDVRRVLDHLAAEGVIGTGAEGSAIPPGAGPIVFPNVPHTGEVIAARAGEEPWAFTSPPYTGLAFRFRFSTDDLELAAYLTAILDPLADADPAHGETDHLYELRAPDADGFPDGLIALDDHVVSRPGTSHLLAATLLWHVNQMVSTVSRSLWQLHASGIVRGGRAIVFPASMNSGKSTLVSGLLLAGNAYITDETVAVDPGTGEVVAYPKAIALDPGSWPVLPTLEPQLDESWRRFEHEKWHVDPRATGAARLRRAEGPTVAAVIFPRYRPDEPTTLVPMGPSEAAVELCRNSFNLAVLGETGIDAVVELASNVPCHRLFVGDLDTAIGVIHDHVDQVLAASGDLHG